MAPNNVFDIPFLLAIPTELRLQIYDYCLADTSTITITAAPITVFGHKIKDRAHKTPIPGLPLDLAPLVRYTYDASLLSLSNPASIALDHGVKVNQISNELPYPAPLALLQSCRLIHDELSGYMRGRAKSDPAKGGLSLYITYPYGVLVLKSLYPQLLRQARNVYISGYYVSPATRTTPRIKNPDFVGGHTPPLDGHFHVTPNNNLRIGSSPPLSSSPTLIRKLDSYLRPYPSATATLAPAALASLISTLLPSTSPALFAKLEARILYPGESSYSSVWRDDHGPIVQILRSICGGKIDMEVSRGRSGNAVVMSVRPSRGRVVSMYWKRLGSGRTEGDGIVVGDHWGGDGAE